MTVTIQGTNDAAVISGATAGSLIEAGSVEHGTPTATGTLTDTDVDNHAEQPSRRSTRRPRATAATAASR